MFTKGTVIDKSCFVPGMRSIELYGENVVSHILCVILLHYAISSYQCLYLMYINPSIGSLLSTAAFTKPTSIHTM